MRSSWFPADLDGKLDVQACSGLCITVPPRGLKRKLQDVETDGNAAVSQQPKVGVSLDTALLWLTSNSVSSRPGGTSLKGNERAGP